MGRNRMSGYTAITVVAKTDGRGQVRPFGKYNKDQAGAMVKIGNKEYKVTSTGRVNIPKKIMEKYGEKGNDGRNRIHIKFATKRTVDGDHTQKVHTQIFRPKFDVKDSEQGFKPAFLSTYDVDIKECDGDDDDDEYSFS